MDKVVMDFDDFCEETNELSKLQDLRKYNGTGFKVTLFTIPNKGSVSFLQDVTTKFPWIQLAIHGWSHDGVGECLKWNKQDALVYLKKSLDMGVFVHGFKAPHWLASYETYEACRDLGLWVALNSVNKTRLPTGLKTYFFDAPSKEGIIQTHGHITKSSGNYIGDHFNNYCLGKGYEYLFIDDLIRLDGDQFN